MNTILGAYLINNMETTRRLVVEVNLHNGALDHLDYIDMELFNEYMTGQDPIWIANKIYYGDFNPNDDYFKFNAYGNLISYDLWDVNAEIQDYMEEVVQAIIDNKDYIDLPEEVEEILSEEE